MSERDRQENSQVCNYDPDVKEKNKIVFFWMPAASVVAVFGWYAQELIKIHDMINEITVSHREHEKRVDVVTAREEKLDDAVTKILQRLSSIEAKIEPRTYRAKSHDDDA